MTHNTQWKMTLRDWQRMEKPREELLYNCSEFDRLNDGWIDFTIGMGFQIGNYQQPLKSTQIGNHEHLVFCAISDWTDKRRRPSAPNRESYLRTLSQNGIHNTKVPPHMYFDILPSVKFVISPEGNGIDCHRHYEALMAGCIPIVEEHDGIRKKYEGCPVLYTKDYSEIKPEYLDKIWAEWIDQSWDFSKLIFSTYPPEVQEQIKANGNYWSERLISRKWFN
jgi:hypothetical protein